MKLITTMCCALVLTSTAVLAHADSDLSDQREDVMKSYEKYLKSIGKMFRGQTDYDAAVVKAGAEQMQAHSGRYLLDLFPEGSGGDGTHAKPLIWEQWDDFSGLVNDLQKSSASLAANADTLESASPYYKDVMSSCKGCHKTYKSR